LGARSTWSEWARRSRTRFSDLSVSACRKLTQWQAILNLQSFQELRSSTLGKTLRIEIPRKAATVLFGAGRYKVLHGGRGSGKSWSVARALLAQGLESPLRILCGREYQRSIDESVHRLLADQVGALGLEGEYTVLRDEIRGRNGTTFTYSGLHHNAASLKSYEGVDRCWIEEGQAVTKPSWDVLTPTIRAPGSEIWVTFNPELEQDEAWQRFIVKPPVGCLSAQMLWSSNPWFPKELEAERLDCLARDPIGYRTIWQGECRASVQGAIYAAELAKARDEGRIGVVPVDRTLPVHTAWDLGYLDPTAIWFFQWTRAGQIRFVDYFEDCKEDVTYYVQAVRDKGYVLGRHIPPHDIKAHHFAHKDSAYVVAGNLGFKFEEPMGPAPVETGIHAVRMAFSRMWFDADKCAVGLQRLAHYRRAFNTALQEFKAEPVHDIASHGSDAMRYGVVGYQQEPGRKPSRAPQAWHESSQGGSWMGR
jgi:phage terminase large subunit